ncbi:MAG TPA: ABC transporter permease [Coriobacteriia bacterium]|nr:ABC transporter permease [Coriobacteriia bacterium]
MIRAALLIARKDLTERVRDRSVFIYGLVAPLGLAIIFNFVFGPIERAEFHANFAVVNEDRGPIAEAFTDLLAGLEDEGIATVVEVDSVREAREMVARGSEQFGGEGGERAAGAAFVIPAGLSDTLAAGGEGSITVIGGEGTQLASQVAFSVAEEFATRVGAVEVAVRTVIDQGGATDPESIQAVAAAAAYGPPPVTVEDVSAATRQLGQTARLAAGMSVFFLFFTVSFGVSGLLGERRTGTMTRLLAAPIDRRSIILGKAVTSFVLGIVSMTILLGAMSLLLGAEWGDLRGVAMLVFAVVFAAMGALAIVAATARTQAQAENFQAILSLVLGFLGGTFFPVSEAGGWLETASLLTPHAWFLQGLGDLQAGELAAVYLPVGALMLFGCVTCALAWPFLRKAVES